MILQDDNWSMSRRKQDKPQHLVSSGEASMEVHDSTDDIKQTEVQPSVHCIGSSVQGNCRHVNRNQQLELEPCIHFN